MKFESISGNIVGEEFKAFAIKFPHFSIPEDPNMLLEIDNILTGAWAASTVIAAASLGVFAIGAALEIEGIIALGVVGIIVVIIIWCIVNGEE